MHQSNSHALRHQRGTTLVEALIAFLVLSLGMLAAARTQTHMRLGADVARQRSEAVRLAQEDIEALRGFTVLAAAPGARSFEAIASASRTVDSSTGLAGNTSYLLARQIEPAVAPHAKSAAVTVSWTDRSGDAQQVALMLASLGVFLGASRTLKMLDDLNLHTLDGYDVRRSVRQLVNDRKRISDWFRSQSVPDREFRYLSARLLPGLPRLLARLACARGETEAAAWFIARMESLGIADAPPVPLLMGRHLLGMGVRPGPQIGEITRRVYFAQLSGDVTTLDEALEMVGRQALTPGPCPPAQRAPALRGRGEVDRAIALESEPV